MKITYFSRNADIPAITYMEIPVPDNVGFHNLKKYTWEQVTALCRSIGAIPYSWEITNITHGRFSILFAKTDRPISV